MSSYQKKNGRRGARKALASNAIRRATIAESVGAEEASQTKTITKGILEEENQIWYKSGELKIAFSLRTAD